eukprot:TRINITY_DN553_c0_g1_i2.p1 TRINITY_DN553_c0_g1~~TRINITY_DN553_c0_g1_i2.p1  ORF type:complete len:338 (+),score=156.90 TRINITY_DN553_c0_g1_i2:33-1016(+)
MGLYAAAVYTLKPAWESDVLLTANFSCPVSMLATQSYVCSLSVASPVPLSSSFFLFQSPDAFNVTSITSIASGIYLASVVAPTSAIGTPTSLVLASSNVRANITVLPVTCNTLRQWNPSLASGTYTLITNPSTTLTAYCDMTTAGGGWTLVGLEKANNAQNLALLGVTVGSQASIAAQTGSGNIGPLLNSQYTTVRIVWSSYSMQFNPSADLFVNSANTNIPLSSFSTTDSTLNSYVSSAGGALFCRAASTSFKPGDTSWAVKPNNDFNTGCGCNSGGWAASGAFYGGAASGCNVCSCWGGGFSGTSGSGGQKGGITPNYDTSIWVR